jgi:hypothetical protein
MLNTNGKAPSRLNGTIKTTGWFAIASMLLLVPRVTAIPLLNGRFETTTDVQYILDLALDAAAMKEANSVVSKTSIYQNVSPINVRCYVLTVEESIFSNLILNMFRELNKREPMRKYLNAGNHGVTPKNICSVYSPCCCSSHDISFPT